jgi:hypothetical protein
LHAAQECFKALLVVPFEHDGQRQRAVIMRSGTGSTPGFGHSHRARKCGRHFAGDVHRLIARASGIVRNSTAAGSILRLSFYDLTDDSAATLRLVRQC